MSQIVDALPQGYSRGGDLLEIKESNLSPQGQILQSYH